MKLRAFCSLIFACSVFLAGWASPAGRVKLSRIAENAPATEAPIEAFDYGDSPDQPFREIASLSYDGMPGDYLEAMREFRIKARQLGADAIPH